MGQRKRRFMPKNGINNLAYPAIITRVGINHQNYLDYKYFVEHGEDPDTNNPGYQDCKKTNLAYLDGDLESRILYTIFSESGSTQAVLAEEMEGEVMCSVHLPAQREKLLRSTAAIWGLLLTK